MSHVDPEKIAKYIEEVAHERIVPRFQNLLDGEISTKTGPSDLVTVADVEAEEDLTKIFKDFMPGCLVIGEEAVSKKEISTEALGSEDGYIWVIDPVDGTHNFAHGKPIFGTMVALVKGGQTIQSWIYNIPGDEWAIAEQGSGVSLQGQMVKYPQQNGKKLNEMRCFIGRSFLPKHVKEPVEKVLKEKYGEVDSNKCCAHDYLDILRGNAYVAMYNRVHPWDHLPGALMMSEAGGFIRKWDKSKYGPGDEGHCGVLVTPDEALWNEIYSDLVADFI